MYNITSRREGAAQCHNLAVNSKMMFNVSGGLPLTDGTLPPPKRTEAESYIKEKVKIIIDEWGKQSEEDNEKKNILLLNLIRLLCSISCVLPSLSTIM